LDVEKNHMEISGRSMPENSRSFYIPIVNWVKKYEPADGTAISINIKYSYVNTSSIIGLLGILKEFKTLLDRNCTINVTWNYEKYDDDMFTIGEDVASLCELEFEYVEYD